MAFTSTFVLSALLLISSVFYTEGHTYLSSITIDGNAFSEGDCIKPQPSGNYNFPLALQSNDMTCGLLPEAANPANRKCPVMPGSQISLEWHYEKPGSSDSFIIDPSHKGPCMIYMAKSETGSGPVWFKIWEDGYSNGQWCVDRLRANRGKISATIPRNLAPGNYLIRGEIIALHGAYALNGAQPYVGCVEVTVGGSGTASPSPNSLVSFPGAYSNNDPGIYLSIYQGIRNYVIPGPAVYSGSSSTPVPPNTPTTPQVVTTNAATTNAATTARASSTPSRVTTGSARLTSGSQTVPSPATTASAGNGGSSPCTLGQQRCTSSNTYQTCGWASSTVTGWSANQACPSGLGCHAFQGDYVWCY